VVLDVVHVERPLGDPRLNESVWSAADPTVLPIERRRLLERYGFRVAVIGGHVADVLDPLVEDDQRPFNAEHLEVRNKSEVHINCSDIYAEWEPISKAPEPLKGKSYEQALAVLQLVPEACGDGSVLLRFTPQVHYGSPHQQFVPEGEPGHGLNWGLQVARKVCSLTQLTFSLRVRPTEYVLIGPTENFKGTLAERFFTAGLDQSPRQRMLLISASAPATAK